jgi:hypothetical protein
MPLIMLLDYQRTYRAGGRALCAGLAARVIAASLGLATRVIAASPGLAVQAIAASPQKRRFDCFPWVVRKNGPAGRIFKDFLDPPPFCGEVVDFMRRYTRY